MSEIIFPHNTPHQAHPKVESMVRLLRGLDLPPEGALRKYAKDQSVDENGFSLSKQDLEKLEHPSRMNALSPSALRHVRNVGAKCRPFVLRAEESKALIDEAKARRSQKISSASDLDLDSSSGAENSLVPVAEANRENIIRAQINVLNYRYCIAESACPERMSRLKSCWQLMGPDIMKELVQHNMAEFVCKDEREAVERCCGAWVSRTLQSAMGGAAAQRYT